MSTGRSARTVLVSLLAAGVVACGGDSAPPGGATPGDTVSATATEAPVGGSATPASTAAPPITPVAPADETARVFDQSVVHKVALQVPPSSLSKLVPGSDERIPARLTFDGTRLDDVGLRLKAGDASKAGLDGKPGFSIDTDTFVKKGNLFGVTRFTLGNEIQDPSFIAEPLAYEVFRRAGVVAPRTALAEVSLNGELYGLYVLREGYDKNFLRRTFEDDDGNLYEGALHVDVTDVEDMELHTNESKDDRSDLEAIAKVVAETPDEEFLAALGKLVDLDQLLTYWAVEALTHHWDGYIRPNNYYVYQDPSRDRLVFLAHGADWAMLDPASSVLAQPGEDARMAYRLYASPVFLEQLRTRVIEVLDRYWDPRAFLAQADQLASLVRSTGLTGSHEVATLAGFENGLAERRAFIAGRAEAARAQLEKR